MQGNLAQKELKEKCKDFDSQVGQLYISNNKNQHKIENNLPILNNYYEEENSEDEDLIENNVNQAVLNKLSNIDDEAVEYYESLLDKVAPRRFIIRKKRGLVTHKTNNGYQGPQKDHHYDFTDFSKYYEDSNQELEDFEDLSNDDCNNQEDYEVEYYENELYKRYPSIFHSKVGKYIPKEEEPDYSLLFLDFDRIFNKKDTYHGKKEPKKNKRKEKVILLDI